jgi:hypothetical protein
MEFRFIFKLSYVLLCPLSQFHLGFSLKKKKERENEGELGEKQYKFNEEYFSKTLAWYIFLLDI